MICREAADLDLIVLGEEPCLSRVAQLCAPLAERGVLVVHTGEPRPLLPERGPAPARCVVLAANEPPQRGPLQALIGLGRFIGAPVLMVLARNDALADARLLAEGVDEVLRLGALTSEGLRSALSSSVARQARTRALQRQRDRAAFKRDAVASIADAHDRPHIYAALSDGLVALGALAATCWEEAGGTYLPHQAGLSHSDDVSAVSLTEWSHQVGMAAALGHATWHQAPLGQVPGAQVLGFIPFEAGRGTEVVCVAWSTMPDEDERGATAQLVCHAEAALVRVAAHDALHAELAAYQQVLGQVSQDLREPLNTLLLGARMLREAADPSLAASLGRLIRAADVATRVTEDLRAFVGRGAGIALTVAAGDLFEVLAGCVTDARARAGARRTVRMRLPADDGRAQFDLARIEQVFGNLLSYALLHARAGSALDVHASGDPYAVYAEITCPLRSDAPTALATLLDADVRDARVAEYGSGGLGLFIAARLVDAHGGRIWAEARGDDSTALCVQIPRSGLAEGAHSAPKLLAHGPTRSAPTPPPLSAPMQALSRAFHADALRSALSLWCAARGDEALPHPLGLARRAMLALLPDMVSVTVLEDAEGELGFRIDELGARLERRLASTLAGRNIAPNLDALATSQHAAYRRCWEIRGPAYDYVRERGANGWLMERLLLPLSRDGGRHIHQLIGIIVFSGAVP